MAVWWDTTLFQQSYTSNIYIVTRLFPHIKYLQLPQQSTKRYEATHSSIMGSHKQAKDAQWLSRPVSVYMYAVLGNLGSSEARHAK